MKKKYVIDPLHSDVSFKIKHLMISNVNGNFGKFDAVMYSDCDKFSDADIEFSADVDTISTNIQDRDNHLKSKDFFDVEAYPKIIFKSTEVIRTGESDTEGEYEVKGLLKIKDVEKEVVLKGTYNGNDVDAYGQTKFGFDLEGKIDRKEWGLTFNLEGGKGSLLIGDEVKLLISVQMIAA